MASQDTMTSTMSTNDPQILRPKPRRPFDYNAAPQQPPCPLLSPLNPETPSRTHSILNLTSSTLFGIYSPTGYDNDKEPPSTPWGTGAESMESIRRSPVLRRESKMVHTPTSTPALVFSLILRSTLLFGLGMLYGLLVRHLHDDRQLAPFQVEGIIKPNYALRYLIFWGVAGVGLGSLLPWFDALWEDKLESNSRVGSLERHTGTETEDLNNDINGDLVAEWAPVVRSVGAFVGIAYAIRKLPWASTLQASLTLALVNPVLWYIIDRSKPGFVLSTAVGATGTALLLVSNPDMMPSPASTSKNSTIEHHTVDEFGNFGSYVSRESIEGGIWILNVLFCSCVCFENIGRRLALNGKGIERVPILSQSRRKSMMTSL